MACYDRVSCSVNPNTGALTVNTKTGSCTIEPGDTVTFTETAVGYIISINGSPNIIPKPDEDDYGDNVSFTETDDEYIITINNIPNVIPKCDRTFINCSGEFIVPCRDRIVTCDELNDAIEDFGPQTQVSNGTGSQANQNTYTVDHKGTWQNETIRTPWMARQGDIAIINVWNPSAGAWDEVAIEAPENIVILNNPVIYVSAQSGSANPPIETQSDLTPANAFNSFAAVRAFMNRTLTVGTVTLDCLGNFGVGGGNIGPAQFKNAQNIVIRGRNNNPNSATFGWGFGGGAPAMAAFLITGGSVTFQNVTFEANNGEGTDYAAAIVPTNASASVTFSGLTIWSGFRDGSAAGRLASYLIRSQEGAQVSIASDSTFVFAMDAGSVLSSIIFMANNASFNIGGDVTFNITGNNITLKDGIFPLRSPSTLLLRTSSNNPSPLIRIGAARFVTPRSVDVFPLSVVDASSAYGSRTDVLAHDFGGVVTSGGAVATIRVAELGVVNNVAGP